MTEPHLDTDTDLKSLFAHDLPPAHDADFVVGVAQRVARRRLAVELGGAALTAAVSALVLWALGPVLGPVLGPMLAPVRNAALLFMPLLAVVAGVLILVHPRPAVV